VRAYKAWWLIIGFLSGFLFALWAEELRVHWKDDRLQFTAPKLHFLAGKPVERLRNGATVTFDMALTLWSGSKNREPRRIAEHFALSYDLWEEKYSVVKSLAPRKTVSNLGAAAAEQWCLDQMTMPVSGVAGNTPLWLRLEIRAAESREGPIFGRGNISDAGISLTSLIEIFSRPAQAAQPHWTLEAGPVTLDQLRRSNGRGS
jgi:hypothetical protein